MGMFDTVKIDPEMLPEKYRNLFSVDTEFQTRDLGENLHYYFIDKFGWIYTAVNNNELQKYSKIFDQNGNLEFEFYDFINHKEFRFKAKFEKYKLIGVDKL